MERYSEICSRTENELALFVGGELDANTRAAVRGHLDTCAECRVRELAARRAHEALVRGLGVSGAVTARAPALWSGVRAGLERDGLLRAPAAPAPVLAGPGSAWWTRRSTWWTAAAAALVLCSAWFARQQFAGQDPHDSNIVVVPPAPVTPGVQPEPLEVTPVSTAPNAFDGVAAVTPFHGLRRLAPNERPLSDSAEPLPSEERSLVPIFSPNGVPSNSAATLRRVRSWP